MKFDSHSVVGQHLLTEAVSFRYRSQPDMDLEQLLDGGGTGVPSGGPNPSNGIITFTGDEGGSGSGSGSGGNDYPTSYLVTCELPDSEHTICTASLNEFLIQNLGQ